MKLKKTFFGSFAINCKVPVQFSLSNISLRKLKIFVGSFVFLLCLKNTTDRIHWKKELTTACGAITVGHKYFISTIDQVKCASSE